MKAIAEYLIIGFMRLLLWFRYRIHVEGLNKLKPEQFNRSSGILFLPNHPTYYIDPMITSLTVWHKFPVRPLIVEYMYYFPVIHRLMCFMRALPVPNFSSSSNSLKRKKNEQVIRTVISDLKRGDNFLLYPAGRTKLTAYEAIGGASALHRILQEAPDANIVLVRIKGLWGSGFSRAIVNQAPSVKQILLNALKIIFKNLIFFTPRRDVTIEFELAPADFPRHGSRLDVNRYLERWYNKPDGLTPQRGQFPGDSLVLVSYSMWGDKFLPLREVELSSDREISIQSIPKEVREKVIRKLAELKECDPKIIRPEMSLSSDLGLDSLDTEELVVFLHEQFDIENITAAELNSVAKVMAVASKQVICEEVPEDQINNVSKWMHPSPHQRAHLASGSTIIESFLNRCQKEGKTVACADGRVGIQTFSSLKLRTIILAEQLRQLPGKYIGIMLPASVAANLLIFAVQLAGKVPLMVNWTVGPRHLESVVQLSNMQCVISSWSFIDRLSNVDLTPIENQLLLLEDIVRKITFKDKLKAIFRSKRPPKKILQTFQVDTLKKTDEAVLLFTSGTEAMPKGVPLSHDNILNNLKSSLEAAEIFTDDVIYGILPPFHSFGFTISGIVGLLAGVKVFYFPDPTDGKKLAANFARWGVTIMVAAPTFIKGMLKSATPEQIKTMRLCVSGAEKAPPELFQMMEHFGKPGCLVEGYGITECAPVLTMNPIGKPTKGVGKAISGVQLCIVKPETEKLLPTGECGLILVKGPNVFNGYLNPGLSSPFTELNGERWYKTGDLGFLDNDGYLTISGRMKRFIKMGGEMVSLAAVEDALLQMGMKNNWQINREGPTFAVCAKEFSGGKSKIFLFGTCNLSVDEINNALKTAGFSNLVKVSSVTVLPELPIMGTGKINYRQLESEYLSNVTS